MEGSKALAHDCATCELACSQPYGVEISTVDGIFIKQMVIPEAHTVVPQHKHRYDHTSMLAKGSVHAWTDKGFLGTFIAPAKIFIKAGIFHTFKSLEDETIIYCIHNVIRNGEVEVTAEQSAFQLELDLSPERI